MGGVLEKAGCGRGVEATIRESRACCFLPEPSSRVRSGVPEARCVQETGRWEKRRDGEADGGEKHEDNPLLPRFEDFFFVCMCVYLGGEGAVFSLPGDVPGRRFWIRDVQIFVLSHCDYGRSDRTRGELEEGGERSGEKLSWRKILAGSRRSHRSHRYPPRARKRTDGSQFRDRGRGRRQAAGDETAADGKQDYRYK